SPAPPSVAVHATVASPESQPVGALAHATTGGRSSRPTPASTGSGAQFPAMSQTSRGAGASPDDSAPATLVSGTTTDVSAPGSARPEPASWSTAVQLRSRAAPRVQAPGGSQVTTGAARSTRMSVSRGRSAQLPTASQTCVAGE